MSNPEVVIVFIFIIIALTNHWWLGWMLRQKFLVYFIVPIILLFVWLGLMVYQSFKIENVITILTDEYSRNSLTSIKYGELYKGDKITGEFTASNNYLGIVGFRFWTFYRLNDDYIIFRIKDKGSSKWYYQNQYKEDQFQPDQYFTFGFPNILDSRDKTYQFEVESSHGYPGVAVGISRIEPSFIVKYKYPKELVTSSTRSTLNFVALKLMNLATKAQFKASSFIYLLPLIIYLITLTPVFLTLESKFLLVINKLLHLNKKVAISTEFKVKVFSKEFTFNILDRAFITFFMITSGVIMDILFIRQSDMTMIVLVFLTYFAMKFYKVSGLILLIYAIISILASAVFYYLNFNELSERSAAWGWLYLFTLMIILLSLNEVKTKKNISKK